MAIRGSTFYKYIEAAFRFRLYDPKGQQAAGNPSFRFNYLGYNLPFGTSGRAGGTGSGTAATRKVASVATKATVPSIFQKTFENEPAYKTDPNLEPEKGIFYYARKILPYAYTSNFADNDAGNLQMARTVLEKLDHEGKKLEDYVNPNDISQEIYDVTEGEASDQSQGDESSQAGPAGGEPAGTMGEGGESHGPHLPESGHRELRRAPRMILKEKPEEELSGKAGGIGRGTGATNKVARAAGTEEVSPGPRQFRSGKDSGIGRGTAGTGKVGRLAAAPAEVPSAFEKAFEGEPAFKTNPALKPPSLDSLGREEGLKTPGISKGLGSAAKTAESDAEIGASKLGRGIGNGLRQMGSGFGNAASDAFNRGVSAAGRGSTGARGRLTRASRGISRGGFFGGGGTGKRKQEWKLALLLFSFMLFAALFTAFTGSGYAASHGEDSLNPGPSSGGSNLDYTIALRDTSIRPVDIRNQIRTRFPNAQLQNWDIIIQQSITNGWNPAFVLALWIEESGAQGAPNYTDALGCAPNQPTTDINLSLRCVYNNFGSYNNNQFADFMCRYSEGFGKTAPCQFVTNPNFPGNLKKEYASLVPSGPGAIQTTPSPTPASPTGTPSSTGTIVSCPLSQNGAGDFRFICGTFNNTRNNCGHGNPSYYNACTQPPYATCPFSQQLKAAVDVRPISGNGADVTVYLPFVYGNNSVRWSQALSPTAISGGADGYKVEYTADFNGKHLRIDLTHLNSSINASAQQSGDAVGTTKRGVDDDGGGHLHTAVSVDGVWQDSISQAHICTP